jgi:hypothetical protein
MVRRAWCVGLALGTMGLGLLLRFGHVGAPWFLYKYGGSVLWAMAVYWVFAAVAPGARAVRVGIWAGVFAVVVEVGKMVRVGWLDAFRVTFIFGGGGGVWGGGGGGPGGGGIGKRA